MADILSNSLFHLGVIPERRKGNLEDYLDEIMREFAPYPSPEEGEPDTFAQRFEGASPEETLRQKMIQDLLMQYEDPIMYEEVPLDQRSSRRPSAHRV